MSRVVAILWLIFSFAVQPAFAGCCDARQTTSTAVESHDKASESGKKDMAAHHCATCNHHVFDHTVPAMKPMALMVISLAIPLGTDGLAPPFESGPLLEPPSHI